MLRWLLLALAAALIAVAAYLGSIVLGMHGRHEEPGAVTGTPIPDDVVSGRAATQHSAASAVGVAAPKQILFGDLHVHTTFSTDAFQASLPMLQGEGAHPPADACDFARYCSALDFWSINDHAEGLTLRRWEEIKQSVRQCNAVAGDPVSPDVVAYLGWEWTQVGLTADEHYGHKNVILRDLADAAVPARPIAAAGPVQQALRSVPLRARLGPALIDFDHRQRYLDFDRFLRELAATEVCAEGVDTRELPADCLEAAATPAELFEKLAQWGSDAFVIPHGTTWGMYTPMGATWDKQLTAAMNDPRLQTLIEVYSGHGNSEEYRDWRAVRFDAAGEPVCPPPRRDYLPSCWRAGEIIAERCRADGLAEAECEARAATARDHYAQGGVAGWLTVPGADVLDWQDSGQCRNCFEPSFNYRPGSSAQYTLAISNFDEPTEVKRFRFGFIASSDNHTARPGTGYKEFARGSMSDGRGPRDAEWYARLNPKEPPRAESIPPERAMEGRSGFQLVERERRASFLVTGGLVAVHSDGRDRNAIWDALERKEVYGTSGERMLLWFDLLNGPAAPYAAPMGSEVAMSAAPRFRVRAVGAFEQLPGCPAYSVAALSPERLEALCRGECYNPSDERKLVTRIEVVRIRPQAAPGEPVGRLIEDPWLRVDCPRDPAGCIVEFEDLDFPEVARDAVYYVRAIQEPSLAVNGANLRCRYDENGRCVELDPCHGDYRTDPDDDCLARVEPRAWSSPIFVDYARPAS
jgi:hypothetical protein